LVGGIAALYVVVMNIDIRWSPWACRHRWLIANMSDTWVTDHGIGAGHLAVCDLLVAASKEHDTTARGDRPVQQHKIVDPQ